MPKHISAVDARKRLGALLDDVARSGAEYVIERAGEPAAVVIPVRAYEQHIKDRGDRFKRIEALRQRIAEHATAEDLEDAIDDATKSVRRYRKK